LPLPNCSGNGIGAIFDYTDNGCISHIFIDGPTHAELANIGHGDIETALAVVEDVIFVLFKFGSFNWMDFPYNFSLSTQLSRVDYVKAGDGLALSIVVVDTATTLIKTMRVVSLGYDFSKAFIDVIYKNGLISAIDINQYSAKVVSIFNRYSSEQLRDNAVFNGYIRSRP